MTRLQPQNMGLNTETAMVFIKASLRQGVEIINQGGDAPGVALFHDGMDQPLRRHHVKAADTLFHL